ncbi:hypothetical protein C8R46DRAFT_923394, partial [Mycena filopes]
AGLVILERKIASEAFYNSEERFPPPQCYPETRTVVQDTIQAWAEAPGPAPGVMWLYGPAGAGKSAVAQTMAERWASSHELGASFFFARWRVGGSSGKTLFPTIAYQLATHFSWLKGPIGRAVQADPVICEKALEQQARVLIQEPFLGLDSANPSGRPHLVIVDGLDECDNKATQSRIVQIISRILVNGAVPLRFLICSRPDDEPGKRLPVKFINFASSCTRYRELTGIPI